MKCIKLSLLLIVSYLLLSNVYTYAQTVSSKVEKRAIGYYNLIKFNPLSLAYSTANFQYERVLNAKYAINLTLTYTNGNGNTGTERYEGWGIQPEFKWYFVEIAPQGFFLSAFTRVSNIDYITPILVNVNNENKLSESITNYFQVNPGITLGFAYNITPWLHTEIFAGPTYRFTPQEGKMPARHFFLQDGLGLRAGLTLGYRF